MQTPAASVTLHESSGAATHACSNESVRGEVAALYGQHAHLLYRYALAVTRDRERALDGVQEAFCRYFTARLGGMQIVNSRGWLVRVLHNVLVDAASEERRSAAPVSALERECTADDPEAAAGITEFTERLPEVLSVRELACVRLRVEGLTYQEIGAEMKIESGTVAALLSRAIRKLRAAFGPDQAC